jgi:hypothetical protein
MTDTGISDGAGTPEPTEPATPVEGVAPVAPVAPAEDFAPAEPVTLAQPVTLSEPNTLIGPAATDTTVAPTDPTTAVEPSDSPVESAEAAARRTRIRRNVLRWTGAVVLTLAVGGGTAFAISIPQRTDVPGLSTPADGRYAFPALSLPTLPAGQLAPSASANTTAQQHLADIRTLLLSKPDGATTPGVKTSGWMEDAYTLFTDQHDKVLFAEYGLRHTATTIWTTPDGATTKIYLLQFADGPATADLLGNLTKGIVSTNATNGLSSTLSGATSGAATHGMNLSTNVAADYTAVTANGKITRYGTFSSGDIIAVVIQSGPAKLPLAPFAQVLTLQAELLQ